MGKKDHQFVEAKEGTIENLEALRMSLNCSVKEGMIDPDSAYYNRLIDVIEEARFASTWEELMEVVSQGRTLETDIAGWLAQQGRTTLSFIWPQKPVS